MGSKSDWHLNELRDYIDETEGRAKGLAEKCRRLLCRVAELEGQTNSYPSEDQLSPEMRARLMPEVMEWPRWETGEPVTFGDVVRGTEVAFVRFADGGDVAMVDLLDCDAEPFLELSPGERVRRPAPIDEKTRDMANSPHDSSVSDADSVGVTPTMSANADSWEQLEVDIKESPWSYCDSHGIEVPEELFGTERLGAYVDCQARDFVRRAKALAGGGVDE